MNTKLKNKDARFINKGSVAFVFYFIIGLALLAVAGYYIGLHEQASLFDSISSKKQQQENEIMNGTSSDLLTNSPIPQDNQNDPTVKSLIDSPNAILRNIKTITGSSNNSSLNNNIVSVNQDSGDLSQVKNLAISNIAKQSQFFIKTSENKNGINVKLVDGEARGSSCYNTATERLCFPDYKFNKVWSLGDLNGDGIDDAILSISAIENSTSTKVGTENFFAMISVTSSSSFSTSSLVNYSIVPFNYGIYSPKVSSMEITDEVVKVVGIFYSKTDKIGNPSINKIVKYKVQYSDSKTSPLLIQNIGEARLFKEQGDRVADWYLYSYIYSGLSFSFRAPDAWQRVESFGDNIKVDFNVPDGRDITFNTSTITPTCSEYGLNLSDNKNIKIKGSEFIDLGQFGAGYYVKYAVGGADDGTSEYHADICVTDSNGDKKLFSLISNSKEDGDPYFVMFDKIFSTFKIK